MKTEFTPRTTKPRTLSPEARHIKRLTDKRRAGREAAETRCMTLNANLEIQKQLIRTRYVLELVDSIDEFPLSLFKYVYDTQTRMPMMQVDMDFVREILEKISNSPHVNDRFALSRKLGRILKSACIQLGIAFPSPDQSEQ